ncbi:MAG: iron uptake transporter deferrochelatase/peroxidase subunit [Thiobacillaceae bacterium]
MSTTDNTMPGRRRFLAKAATMAAVTAASTATGAAVAATRNDQDGNAEPKEEIEPFFGVHQSGIATPQQANLYFAAFDLLTKQRQDVAALMRSWTQAAARLTAGHPAAPAEEDLTAAPLDSGDTVGLPARRLTITFGFGAGLFFKDGVDRYGLAPHRPEALIDLPRFNGDQMIAERTGGDLAVQICADDPQVTLHAIRQLARLADGIAKIRWVHTGFVPSYGSGQTGRNLMGFKDGTMNISGTDAASMAKYVWVADQNGWMNNGSYMVVRPIRIALEHWDRMKLGFQEQVVGRHKLSGAPLGGKDEHDPLDFDANDADGNPVLPENSHTRLAAPASNGGTQILRRGYAYQNGVSLVAERWPPWHQGTEFDAGLFFVCYQQDPRTGFVKVFEKVSKFDMMNQFVTHTGSGLFACPGGVSEGGFVGQALLEA